MHLGGGASRSLSSSMAWSTERVTRQLGIHRQKPVLKNKTKHNKTKKISGDCSSGACPKSQYL